MKPNKMCMTCQLLPTCTLTRITEQCPVIIKPANEPFDKELKTPKWKQPDFYIPWDAQEGKEAS